jgi:hypothetical protein
VFELGANPSNSRSDDQDDSVSMRCSHSFGSFKKMMSPTFDREGGPVFELGYLARVSVWCLAGRTDHKRYFHGTLQWFENVDFDVSRIYVISILPT